MEKFYVVIDTRDGSVMWQIPEKDRFATLSVALDVARKCSAANPLGKFVVMEPFAYVECDVSEPKTVQFEKN